MDTKTMLAEAKKELERLQDVQAEIERLQNIVAVLEEDEPSSIQREA